MMFTRNSIIVDVDTALQKAQAKLKELNSQSDELIDELKETVSLRHYCVTQIFFQLEADSPLPNKGFPLRLRKGNYSYEDHFKS